MATEEPLSSITFLLSSWVPGASLETTTAAALSLALRPGRFAGTPGAGAAPAQTQAQLRFRSPNDQELDEARALALPRVDALTPVLDVSATWNFDRAIRVYLEELAQNRVPGSEAPFVTVEPDGITTTARWELLPDAVGDLFSGSHQALTAATWRLLRFLRWRQGLSGLGVTVENFFQWSIDGARWHPTPAPELLEDLAEAAAAPLHFGEGTRADAKAQLDRGIDEPLGHDLWRDAWRSRLSDPRGALVIGLTAAEMGFKEFVSRVSPEASWLLLRLQGPPLVDLLTGFLPGLLASLPAPPDLRLDTAREGKRTDSEFADPVLRALHQGLLRRNALLYDQGEFPGAAEVTEVLEAVRDLLYLLDHYSGDRPWAAGHISDLAREHWRSTAAAWR